MTPEHRYEITIYWSGEDHAYLAEVPELPGCIADGATYQHALVECLRAMSAWIDSVADVREDKTVPGPNAGAYHELAARFRALVGELPRNGSMELLEEFTSVIDIEHLPECTEPGSR